MTFRNIPVAFVLVLVLAGCGPESTKTVPEDLTGVWKTSDPKYADRSFQLTRDSVTFWTGEGQSYTRAVVKVTKVQENRNVLYTVFYRDPGDPEKFEFKFAFYYDAAADGVIRWKNHQYMAWVRERR